jgi:hypothetical protein
LFNANTTTAKIGYYKITVLKIGAWLYGNIQRR